MDYSELENPIDLHLLGKKMQKNIYTLLKPAMKQKGASTALEMVSCPIVLS